MTCSDCKGTGVYVGLGMYPAEPCRACSVEPPAEPAGTTSVVNVDSADTLSGHALDLAASIVGLRRWAGPPREIDDDLRARVLAVVTSLRGGPRSPQTRPPASRAEQLQNDIRAALRKVIRDAQHMGWLDEIAHTEFTIRVSL